MLRSIGIVLGIAGTALWLMPLAEFYFSALKYTMSMNGNAASELTPMTYGVPISMGLFSASAYMSQWQLQVGLSILGAVSTAVLYKSFGGGYTTAFVALSVVTALCVALSLVNAVAAQRRGA